MKHLVFSSKEKPMPQFIKKKLLNDYLKDMNMKMFEKVFLAALFIILSSFLYSCGKPQKDRDPNKVINTSELASDHVEVIYFHGGMRCASCVAMEKFGKQAIDSVFPKELQNGSLIFRSIDLMAPEGEKLGDKYEVASSSFLIIEFKDGEETVTDMTAFGFRNAKDNRNVFKQGVIDEVAKLLK
ncbi:MAG: thioredoxin [Muribaculaceae bacterium]|nr:thioredoxin [Muribaculaceae bacterium]